MPDLSIKKNRKFCAKKYLLVKKNGRFGASQSTKFPHFMNLITNISMEKILSLQVSKNKCYRILQICNCSEWNLSFEVCCRFEESMVGYVVDNLWQFGEI